MFDTSCTASSLLCKADSLDYEWLSVFSAVEASGLRVLGAAPLEPMCGMVVLAASVSYPSFFMSLVTMLKVTFTVPWDLTLVTERENV